MKRARDLFSEQERRSIAAAVGEAERHTAGEIVPVVASVSGRYDRAEDLCGLVVAVVALAVAWLWGQGIHVAEGEWAATQTLGLGLLPVLAIVVVGFLAGTVAASYIPVLRLPFLGATEMAQEVERGAAAAFRRCRVRATAGGTGILIYVSLYERMVRVCGDEAVDKRLLPGDWDAICRPVIDGLRADRAAEGLIEGVRRAGELLQRQFPAQPGDRNELTNELRLID